MKSLVILVLALGLASSQHFHVAAPLKETRHLQAIQQPHLPQDQNVVAATQQFLNRFAQLKALADAAPDPPRHRNQKIQAPSQQVQHLQGQFIPVFIPKQQQLKQPQQHRQVAHQQQGTRHLLVPVVNHHGVVVNPNRYPGPLAHSLPASVGG